MIYFSKKLVQSYQKPVYEEINSEESFSSQQVQDKVEEGDEENQKSKKVISDLLISNSKFN
jgi:hypothetical protein